MRIALTHNLKITGLRRGSRVRQPGDRSPPSPARSSEPGTRWSGSRSAAQPPGSSPGLEALQPDLIFNTAEGHKGKTREAFYPSLFDELGIPYTGSDAYTLNVALDKSLTKRVLASYGVATPRARLVNRTTLDSGALDDMSFPVIVKPNLPRAPPRASSERGASARTRTTSPRSSSGSSPRFEAGLHRRALHRRHRRRLRLRRRASRRRTARATAPASPRASSPRSRFVIDPQVPGSYNVYDYQPEARGPSRSRAGPAQLPRAHDRAHPGHHGARRARPGPSRITPAASSGSRRPSAQPGPRRPLPRGRRAAHPPAGRQRLRRGGAARRRLRRGRDPGHREERLQAARARRRPGEQPAAAGEADRAPRRASPTT